MSNEPNILDLSFHPEFWRTDAIAEQFAVKTYPLYDGETCFEFFFGDSGNPKGYAITMEDAQKLVDFINTAIGQDDEE